MSKVDGMEIGTQSPNVDTNRGEGIGYRNPSLCLLRSCGILLSVVNNQVLCLKAFCQLATSCLFTTNS